MNKWNELAKEMKKRKDSIPYKNVSTREKEGRYALGYNQGAKSTLDSVLTWMKLLDMQEEEEGEE